MNVVSLSLSPSPTVDTETTLCGINIAISLWLIGAFGNISAFSFRKASFRRASIKLIRQKSKTCKKQISLANVPRVLTVRTLPWRRNPRGIWLDVNPLNKVTHLVDFYSRIHNFTVNVLYLQVG